MPLFSNQLVIHALNGPFKGVKTKCTNEILTIGTSPEVDYSKFDDSSKVSRKHARIEHDSKQQAWWLRDDGSSRGTWVCCGSASSTIETFTLHGGTMIKVGKTIFTVVEEENASSAPAGRSAPDCDEQSVAENSIATEKLQIDHKSDAGSLAGVKYTLKYRRGNSKGSIKLPLEQNTYTIGTGSSCDIQVEDDSATTEEVHAKLSLVDGNYVVEDLGSNWGTFVKLSSSGLPFELNWGDVILVGYAKLAIVKGISLTLWKNLDECCMKSALKCFGVDNINMHNHVAQSIGKASLYQRWKMHRDHRRNLANENGNDPNYTSGMQGSDCASSVVVPTTSIRPS